MSTAPSVYHPIFKNAGWERAFVSDFIAVQSLGDISFRYTNDTISRHWFYVPPQEHFYRRHKLFPRSLTHSVFAQNSIISEVTISPDIRLIEWLTRLIEKSPLSCLKPKSVPRIRSWVYHRPTDQWWVLPPQKKLVATQNKLKAYFLPL